MKRHCPVLLAATMALGMTGCAPDRHSSSGFRLPPDASVERGKVAFAALGCPTCHLVAGSDLPRPTVQPPVPVVLGGKVPRPLADGYLVTSIINPSYELARYPRAQVTAGGRSRMPQYADRMTVQQLADVVEFLQAQYTVEEPPPAYVYR